MKDFGGFVAYSAHSVFAARLSPDTFSLRSIFAGRCTIGPRGAKDTADERRRAALPLAYARARIVDRRRRSLSLYGKPNLPHSAPLLTLPPCRIHARQLSVPSTFMVLSCRSAAQHVRHETLLLDQKSYAMQCRSALTNATPPMAGDMAPMAEVCSKTSPHISGTGTTGVPNVARIPHSRGFLRVTYFKG